jgi:hypothetical protein
MGTGEEASPYLHYPHHPLLMLGSAGNPQMRRFLACFNSCRSTALSTYAPYHPGASTISYQCVRFRVSAASTAAPARRSAAP